MLSTARRIGIPLIGHAPDNLGIRAVLTDHQNLAHSGILVALYFVPRPVVERFLRPSLIALVASIALSLCVLVITISDRVLRRATALGKRWRTAGAMITLSLLFVLMWPVYGLLSDSTLFLVLLSIVSLAILYIASLGLADAWRTWNTSSAPWERILSTAFAVATLSFSLSLFVWVPIAWRCSRPNLTRVAEAMHEAGIWVEPTLDVYQNLNRLNDGQGPELLAEPLMQYVPQSLGDAWTGAAKYKPSRQERALNFLFRRNLGFAERVVGNLQDAGVPLMLSTDTFGFPFCIAGQAAHDEMDLMQVSGLSRFQILQSATSNPARFLSERTSSARLRWANALICCFSGVTRCKTSK